MKNFTVESKMRITFELFNDKQIEEVKKFADENNMTLFSAIARLYGIDTAEFILHRGKFDMSNPCRMSMGAEVEYDLQAENESLKNKLTRVLLSVDTVKEMNTMATIDEHRKQAVKEFAEKLKAKAFQGYQVGMYIVDTKTIDEMTKEFLKYGR